MKLFEYTPIEFISIKITDCQTKRVRSIFVTDCIFEDVIKYVNDSIIAKVTGEKVSVCIQKMNTHKIYGSSKSFTFCVESAKDVIIKLKEGIEKWT